MSPELADPAEELQSVAGLTSEARTAAAIVGDDETIILIVRPSAWFIVATSLRAVPAAAAAGAALALASLDPAIPWDYRGALFASLAIILARASWQAVDWFLRVYVLTDRRIVVRKGTIPEVRECPLSEIAGVGHVRRWEEIVVGLDSLAIMVGPSRRSRRAKRFRQAAGLIERPVRESGNVARREEHRVNVNHALEWSVIRDPESARRTILAAVARYR